MSQCDQQYTFFIPDRPGETFYHTCEKPKGHEVWPGPIADNPCQCRCGFVWLFVGTCVRR